MPFGMSQDSAADDLAARVGVDEAGFKVSRNSLETQGLGLPLKSWRDGP